MSSRSSSEDAPARSAVRPFLKLLAGLGAIGMAALAVQLGAACAPQRPNLLLVTLDTTRADALGAYGQKLPVTPNLDRLAREGTRFARAYSVTPLTIPAHSSMMTGLYPPRHGVQDNGDFLLGDEAQTLAERLKGAGYATMASVGAEVTSRHWGFSQGFDAYFDGLARTGEADENRWKVERPGSAVAKDAAGWWAQLPKGASWFAWTHFFDAHHPYAPEEPWASQFPAQPYLAEVASVDARVGELLTALETRGDLLNTCVIVVADHGESLGAHGEGFHGVLLYDETTHIPMIGWCGEAVRTRFRSGATVELPTSLVDLYPTFLELAGLAPEAAKDGRSLLQEIPADRQVYAESLYALRHYGWAPQQALVTATHKLISSTTPELYAREDARERQDLAGSEPTLLQDLRAKLGALVATMSPTSAAERASLDPERMAQLEALGYLTGAAEAAGPVDTLPDPVRRLPVLRRVEEARQAMRTGDLAAARPLLEALVADEPGLGEPQMMLADVHARQGDLAGAIRIAEAMDAQRPTAPVKVTLGAFRLRSGNVAGAVESLRGALDMDPTLGTAWPLYLHALALSGDPSLATEVARARKLLPEASAPAAYEGLLLATSGDAAGAEPLVAEALRRDPTTLFMNHALGLIRRQQGDTLGAEAALAEEVRLHAPALLSRRALVELYAEQKRYAEQLAQLDAILALVPQDPPTLHSRAQALFNLKRWEDARVAVDSCRAAAPSYAGCAMLEANVLDKLGKKQEALAAYHRALALAGQKAPEGPAAAGKAPPAPAAAR